MRPVNKAGEGPKRFTNAPSGLRCSSNFGVPAVGILAAVTVTTPAPGAPPPEPLAIADVPSRADRAFRRVTTGAGLSVLGLLVVIGFFLVYRSVPAFQISGFGFFSTIQFDAASGQLGVLGLIYGTIVVALIAVAFAVPLSILAALFISDYASGRMRGS